MPLDLPDGTAGFLDANILYYALVPTAGVSQHCLALVERVIAARVSASVNGPASNGCPGLRHELRAGLIGELE